MAWVFSRRNCRCVDSVAWRIRGVPVSFLLNCSASVDSLFFELGAVVEQLAVRWIERRLYSMMRYASVLQDSASSACPEQNHNRDQYGGEWIYEESWLSVSATRASDSINYSFSRRVGEDMTFAICVHPIFSLNWDCHSADELSRRLSSRSAMGTKRLVQLPVPSKEIGHIATSPNGPRLRFLLRRFDRVLKWSHSTAVSSYAIVFVIIIVMKWTDNHSFVDI